MCKNCLKSLIESIDEYTKEIDEHLEKNKCKCCSVYPKFLRSINMDCKVLCLTKIKKGEQVCPKGFLRLEEFEEELTQKIKHKLNMGIERIDECKEDINEQSYITKMNQLKELNDLVEAIQEADHR